MPRKESASDPGIAALLGVIVLCLSPWPVTAQALATSAGAGPPSATSERAPIVVGDFSSGLAADGAPLGWQLAKHAGSPDIRIFRESSLAALEMRSQRASFGVQRALSIDLASHPYLSWMWLVDELPRGGDFRSSETDDQAAQLYVVFPGMRVIAYFWESTPPAGTVGEAMGIPLFAKVKVLVLRSGPNEARHWLLESRDLLADYRALFGEELGDKRVLGLRLWTNSQHTASSSACAFADIAFKGIE